MNKAYKFRIYPNKEQKILLAKTFGCVRFIYNTMLHDKIKYYEETKELLQTTPAQYKKQYEWLKEVDSLALANTQLQLQAAYRNFFRQKDVGFPKYKSKKLNHKSYTTNCVNGNIKLTEKYLVIPKTKSIRIKQHRIIPKTHTIKSVTISQTPTDKYFASILCYYDETPEKVEPQIFVGLDFSMKELYVASDNTKGQYPRYYTQTLEKLQQASHKLSKMKNGSNNRNKQRIKVAKIHEKVANQRKDFLHKASNQITNDYDVICIETLNMKTMSQTFNFGKSVADNANGMFVTMLKYKAIEKGKYVVMIDKWFPSSKTCSVCGYYKNGLKLSNRTYTCDACGAVIDRDINASINIKNEGKRLLLA